MKRTTAWILLVAFLVVVLEAMWVANQVGVDSDGRSRRTAAPIDSAATHALADVGANLPPRGRSLFDQLLSGSDSARWRIPFPFSKLVTALSEAGGCKWNRPDARCYETVLIPLGRSLQRNAAAPEFFKYPRMVAAFIGEPKMGTHGHFPLLKDRLYLGYQEKANLVEVISFNETAGRFEFQLVKNYAAGAQPQVFYANRSVCVSCHQNQAPIFSRQVWDETNANPEIASRLAKARADFDGLPVRVGVDVPNAIDDATDRANLLAAYQLLWRDGCGASRRCRARALAAALQYRLTNERGFDFQSNVFQHDFIAPLEKNWQAHWPSGLKIPSNDIPNRDPLQFADSERLAHVPARFEPLLARGHKEVWQWETDRFRLIKGIGEFFSSNDIRLLAEKLGIAFVSKSTAEEILQAPGFAALDRAIDRMLADPAGQTALDQPTIQRVPLRAALWRALNIDAAKFCCVADAYLPPALTDEAGPVGVVSGNAGLNHFYAHCARCHATREPFPPNFMYGASENVQRNLQRCAERILFRLSMWQVEPDVRPKTPMPPETGLPIHAERWATGSELAAMRAYVEPFVDAALKHTPDKWLGRSYEMLPSCTLH
jgi:hypothetical protein